MRLLVLMLICFSPFVSLGCSSCCDYQSCKGCENCTAGCMWTGFGDHGCAWPLHSKNYDCPVGGCAGLGCPKGAYSCPRGWDMANAEPRRGSRCYHHEVDDCRVKRDAKVLARNRIREFRLAESDLSKHFEDGFEQAYVDVAQGSDGRAPVVPPQRYWKNGYRTQVGHSLAHDWFAGYEAGVESAEADGLDFNKVATSLNVASHMPDGFMTQE